MVSSRWNKRDAGLRSAPETQGAEGMLLLSFLLHSHFLGGGDAQMRNCPPCSGGCMLVTPSFIIPHPSFLPIPHPLPSSPPHPSLSPIFPGSLFRSTPRLQALEDAVWLESSAAQRPQSWNGCALHEQTQEMFPSTFPGWKTNKIHLCPFSPLEDVPPTALQTPRCGDEDFGSTVGFCPDT